MSKWKEEYFRDFTVETETGKNGKTRRVYVYHGDYYFWENPRQVKRNKVLCAGLYVVNVAVYFLTSLGIPYQAKYLTIPTMLGLFALVVELYALVQLCAAKGKLREFDFNDLNTRLLVSAACNAVISFAGVPLSLYYGFQTGDWRTYAVSALGFAVCGLCGGTVYLLHRKLRPVMVEAGDAGEH